MLVSTVLNLFFTPALYLMMQEARARVSSWRHAGRPAERADSLQIGTLERGPRPRDELVRAELARPHAIQGQV